MLYFKFSWSKCSFISICFDWSFEIHLFWKVYALYCFWLLSFLFHLQFFFRLKTLKFFFWNCTFLSFLDLFYTFGFYSILIFEPISDNSLCIYWNMFGRLKQIYWLSIEIMHIYMSLTLHTIVANKSTILRAIFLLESLILAQYLVTNN